MTLTMTAEPTLTGEVSAVELHDAMKAITAFAATDWTVPILTALYIKAEGETLTVTATDRYVLGRWTIAYQGEAFTALVMPEDVKLMLAALKPLLKTKMPVTLAAKTLSLTLITPSGSVKTTDYHGPDAYPKVDALLWDVANASLPDGMVRFNPALLAKFTKIVGKGEPITMFYGGDATKSVRVTAGTHFTGLIMPMRGSSI